MSQTNQTHDPVNHPSHYTSGKYEVIDIIKDQLTPEAFRGFCLGNSIKYILRSGKKEGNPIKQDLGKSRYYLNAAIKSLEEQDEKEFMNWGKVLEKN